MKRAARLGDGWYGWWAQPDIEQHLNNLRSIMNDAGRDVSDDDFSFRLGLPLRSLDPQVINDHVQQAKDLGIDELILAPPIPVRDFDRHLSSVAGAAGLI
jgi:alkanesulfonate monooxygenase SsuD/methylene tetrahydromethanopterin reductase-like flavin-dependent oxidoreductase (luciferase family)